MVYVAGIYQTQVGRLKQLVIGPGRSLVRRKNGNAVVGTRVFNGEESRLEDIVFKKRRVSLKISPLLEDSLL